MKRWVTGLVALGGLLMVGAGLQAHHAVAGVYDLGHEAVLEGKLNQVNFPHPHRRLRLTVPQ